MPSKSKHQYSSSAESTRPNISPEKEAEYCRLAVSQVRALRERLENSDPGHDHQKALNQCVKMLSMTATEATTLHGGVSPNYVTQWLRSFGGDGFYFQHKGRWRIWTAYVRASMEEDAPDLR
jgi:hypothetical protein